MSLASVLFTPLMLLVPLAAGIESDGEAEGVTSASDAIPSAPETRLIPEEAAEGEARTSPASFATLAHAFRAQPANQVRIEQRVTIRIAPRPTPVVRNMLMDLPGREISPRLAERKIGKCLPMAGIAGVQSDRDNRLLLFMRDRRIVSAALERSCRSRDFYSGFYLTRTQDGQLCVDRDTLLSRSGANCKLTRIRQLVEDDD